MGRHYAELRITKGRCVCLSAYDYGRKLDCDQGIAIVSINGYSQNGFWVIDVTVPVSPHILTEVLTRDDIGGLAVRDGWLVLSTYDEALLVYDISQPASPQYVTRLELDFWPSHMTWHQDYLLATASNSDVLYAISLSAEAEHISIERIDLPVEISGFVVRDCSIYSNTHWEVRILEAGEPLCSGSFGEIMRGRSSSGAFDVLLVGDYFYSVGNVLNVHDVRNISSTMYIGNASYGTNRGVVLHNHLALCGPGAAVTVAPLHCADPHEIADAVASAVDSNVPEYADVLFATPNPFNPQTTIHFNLPRRTTVELRVYDLTGRIVRVLADDEVYSAGNHSVVWRGLDETGRAMPSGTYLVRLQTDDGVRSRKVSLIR